MLDVREEKPGGAFTVYNFEIANDHSYFVGDNHLHVKIDYFELLAYVRYTTDHPTL